MKSVEELLEMERQRYIADQTKKGFNEGAILTTWKESVMVADTVEHKLSNAKKLNSKAGIKESAPISESRRIERKNGTAINEGAKADRDGRILHYMESGFNYREACFMIGETPKGDVKQPVSITEAFTAKWKKYAPWLSESDARTLAERGKSPE
jgi:hypothetical protein